MHALLLVANVFAMNVTEAPLVLDGCSTASAERAAQIAALDPQDPATLDSIAEFLHVPDGETCLLETWTLARVYHAQPDSSLVSATLVHALASDEAHIAARAARIVRVIGVGDAGAFAAIIRQPDLTLSGWHALRVELATMHASPRQEMLARTLDGVAPTTATNVAR